MEKSDGIVDSFVQCPVPGDDCRCAPTERPGVRTSDGKYSPAVDGTHIHGCVGIPFVGRTPFVSRVVRGRLFDVWDVPGKLLTAAVVASQ